MSNVQRRKLLQYQIEVLAGSQAGEDDLDRIASIFRRGLLPRRHRLKARSKTSAMQISTTFRRLGHGMPDHEYGGRDRTFRGPSRNGSQAGSPMEARRRSVWADLARRNPPPNASATNATAVQTQTTPVRVNPPLSLLAHIAKLTPQTRELAIPMPNNPYPAHRSCVPRFDGGAPTNRLQSAILQASHEWLTVRVGRGKSHSLHFHVRWSPNQCSGARVTSGRPVPGWPYN